MFVGWAVTRDGGPDRSGYLLGTIVQVGGQALDPDMGPLVAPLQLDQFVRQGAAGDEQDRRSHRSPS